ncbi:MAG: hypothetical protein JOZ58_02815 [Acetobacteraceae bacterium]|nr:hypothetical protein [Acetobacteraceae bacterium]
MASHIILALAIALALSACQERTYYDPGSEAGNEYSDGIGRGFHRWTGSD